MGNIYRGLLLLHQATGLVKHQDSQVRVWKWRFNSLKMLIWELTEILLTVLLHLDPINFDQTERQSLGCWKIAQAKQNLSTILKIEEDIDTTFNQRSIFKSVLPQSGLMDIMGLFLFYLFVKYKRTVRGKLYGILHCLLCFLKNVFVKNI